MWPLTFAKVNVLVFSKMSKKKNNFILIEYGRACNQSLIAAIHLPN